MRAGLRKLAESVPRIDFSAHPAGLALCWLVAGLLFGLGDEAGLPGARLLGLALATAMALVARGPGLHGLALLAVGGAVLVRLHMAAPWRTYPKHLPRQVCRVWLRGVAVTPTSPGEAQPRIALRVGSLRTWAADPWLPCRGTVQVQLPPATPTPAYGERIEVAGTLAPVGESPDESLFDYSRHLWKRGIVDWVAADAVLVTGRDRWRMPLAAAYRLRARLAVALARGVPAAEEQAILQAMVLGYRQRLVPETREQFLKSSTIHVFAISGLHVGIVAVLCSWALVLLGMPFRLRSLLLIPLVGSYVFMCGAAVSAVRAWLMLSCWWGSQMLQRPRVPLNAIAVAALLALLWRPLVLLETGFLFSFLVVGVLVAGWPLASDLVAALGERRWWLPPAARQNRAARWSLVPARSLAVSSLAWLGSAGMVASSNGLLVPVGLFLNLGVVLLCAVLLAAATAKIVISCLGWRLLEQVLGWALGALAQCLLALTEIADLPGASFRISPLPALLAAVYYGLLFVALVRRPLGNWRLLLFAACGLVLLVPTLHGRMSWPADQVLVGDGATVPAVLLTRPRGLPPVVLNTGGSLGSRRLQAILERTGTGELEAMVFSAGHRDACAGSAPLLARWPVRTLVVPANYRRSAVLADLVNQRRGRGARVRILPEADRTIQLGVRRLELVGKGSAQQFRLAIGHPATDPPTLQLDTTWLGTLCVSLAGESGTEGWTAPRGSAPARLRIVQPRWPRFHAQAHGHFTLENLRMKGTSAIHSEHFESPTP